ncbi:PDDEXK nuclease domain-containing protein [Spirosoma flavum]
MKVKLEKGRKNTTAPDTTSRLRRLVAIALKLGRFKAACKGQMELYLGWLKQYEMLEGEASPIGLILCAEKTREHIELLQLDKGDIRVAEYLPHQ